MVHEFEVAIVVVVGRWQSSRLTIVEDCSFLYPWLRRVSATELEPDVLEDDCSDCGRLFPYWGLMLSKALILDSVRPKTCEILLEGEKLVRSPP